MQENTTTFTSCPACQAPWRSIEITLQACEKCLHVVTQKPAQNLPTQQPTAMQ